MYVAETILSPRSACCIVWQCVVDRLCVLRWTYGLTAAIDMQMLSTSLRTTSTQTVKVQVGSDICPRGVLGTRTAGIACVFFVDLLTSRRQRLGWMVGFGADNYDKFSGATSIGSDQYYGTGSSASGGGGGSGFGGGGGGGGGGGSRRQGESVFGVSKLISKLGGQ